MSEHTPDHRREAAALARRCLERCGAPVVDTLWRRAEAAVPVPGRIMTVPQLATQLAFRYLGWYSSWAFERTATEITRQAEAEHVP